MTALRLYLIVAWTALVVLTSFVVARHGVATSFADFGAVFPLMGWQAQYNADFLVHLSLAGLWTGWRNGWSVGGWVLGFCALMGGGMFLLAYLLILLHLEKGDLRRVLLGTRAG